MRKMVATVSIAVVAMFSVMPARAAAPTPDNTAAVPLGMVPVHGLANKFASSGGNLAYHSGGSVEASSQTTYAVYWGSGFNSSTPTAYQSLINSYFSNVAADNGKTSNVYYSDTQYYQTISGTQYIAYKENFGGSWVDGANPTTSGCSSTAGGTVACVSDSQIQSEVAKALTANPTWLKGSNAEVFVFLGNGISTCYSSSSCFVSQFCAYHSHYGSGSNVVLYANMPYTGYSLSACGSGNYPNGDPAADSTINVTSHEANETVTDELGNAWYDRRGYENGDKCAWNFGTALGGVSGAAYNQLIGGGKYYLQQEWSNHSSGCVLTGQ